MSRLCNSTSPATVAAAMQSVLAHRSACGVRVVSSTWNRDSHDLFDFESQHLHTKTFSIPSSVTCIRNGVFVETQAEGTGSIPLGSEPLVRVLERGGTYWVDKASPSTGSKKLWMVVRNVAPLGYKLSEGDIIKLGRFKFRVRQLVGADSESVQPDLGLDDSVTCCEVQQPDPTLHDCESKACRICLLNEGLNEDDPLIAPCQCRGSIEHVHLQCLRYWTKSRLSLEEKPLGSYFYRPLACELCKSAYPTFVKCGGGKQELLMEVPKTQPPFIVLENIVRDNRQHFRGLHVISLAEKALMLGRGHESDVRIADVSISRCHSTISYQNGDFLLQDNNSKFGTLVALKRPRQIEAETPLSLQIGRTVLSFTLDNDLNAVAGPAVLPGSTALPPPPAGVRLPPTPLEEERQRNLRLMLLTRRGNTDSLEAMEEEGMPSLPFTRHTSF